MLLISAIFVLILGVTLVIPMVLPGLLIVMAGALASAAVSGLVFRLTGHPNR